ncbi:hypothetical protein KP509_16G081900 [Ceratopteris richardii]|uniref:N-acetyltransferase ESCO2 n=1 Tax=Ceratopteris richardii TaxID=49495 RepID=A0A8T2T434_CERRI|nr:hypothetical protein KP509_16G081900 [Ceratopteris richardii]
MRTDNESTLVIYGRRKRRNEEEESKQGPSSSSSPVSDYPSPSGAQTLEDSGDDDKQALPPLVSPPSAINHSGKCRQYFLDFGQNEFSFSTCRICGLLYARGHSEDERLHTCFHKRYLNGISFKGWKRERIVSENKKDNGRTIMVMHSDPPQHLLKIYLYIASKKVLGCAIVEGISQAYQVVRNIEPMNFNESKVLQTSNGKSLQPSGASNCLAPEVGRSGPGHQKVEHSVEKCSFHDRGSLIDKCNIADLKNVKDAGRETLVFGNVKFRREKLQKQSCQAFQEASAESHTVSMEGPVSAVCGIRGLWVSKPDRRKGIATGLIDAVRSSFLYGVVLDFSQCAFFQPTSDGKAFAAKYNRMCGYLIYS